MTPQISSFHMSMGGIRLAVCLLLVLSCTSSLAAGEDKSTVTITDKAGETYVVSNFELSHSSEKLKLGMLTLTFPAGKINDTAVPKEVVRIIPLRTVREIIITKEGNYNALGKATVKTADNTTENIQCGRFTVKGKQDLGELGTGDFSIAEGIRQIAFSWHSGAKKSSVWPPKDNAVVKGRIVLDGCTVTLDNMALYYQTSHSSCPIHSWCVGCNMRRSWQTGHIASTLKIHVKKSDVDLAISKIRRIDIKKYPEVEITLKSGANVSYQLKLEGYNQGFLAEEARGFIFIPMEQIKSVEFQ